MFKRAGCAIYFVPPWWQVNRFAICIQLTRRLPDIATLANNKGDQHSHLGVAYLVWVSALPSHYGTTQEVFQHPKHELSLMRAQLIPDSWETAVGWKYEKQLYVVSFHFIREVAQNIQLNYSTGFAGASRRIALILERLYCKKKSFLVFKHQKRNTYYSFLHFNFTPCTIMKL